MSALRVWNLEQSRVFLRYCSIHGVLLTPETAVRLATRYAEKHARERSLLHDQRRAHAPRPASDAAA